MMKNRTYLPKSRLLFASLALLMASTSLTAGEKLGNQKKLKIVFLMGQSNMVGHCDPRTAWYLTRPMYIPPREVALAKSRYYDSTFYWQGVNYAYGSKEFIAKGKALLAERRASRKRWRSLVYGNSHGKRHDWLPEYGPMPKTGTKNMYPFLNKKAEEEGIYKRMAEYIESPANKFPPKAAYEQLCKRDDQIASDIKRVRGIFLKNTKPEDFDRFDADVAGQHLDRAVYAELARNDIHLPIAARTRISAFGEVSGEATDYDHSNATQGVLSVGYGANGPAIGPEYAFGITFEHLVNGPVLLVKCSWGGTSMMSNWRPPSLSHAETPIEKATREAENKAAAEEAKKAGMAFKPKQPQAGTGHCWERAMAHIRNVLADPGKYDPDYDPKAGYELTGLVWFQGWNDMGNPAYGEQLVHFIKDFRKEIKHPDLPVVCGLLGGNTWKHTTFDGNVNSGMLYAAKDADLKGTVDIVNTVKYNPAELGFPKAVMKAYAPETDEYKNAQEVQNRAISNFGFHYFGDAKFLILTGDAMARKLANLMNGGEPSIFKEAEEIRGQK